MRWLSEIRLNLRAWRYASPEFGDVCAVLSAGANASIAYLVEPRLNELGLGYKLVDSTAPAGIGALNGCRIVVVVRRLPTAWIGPLWRFRKAGGRVVYFMDDDLMDRSVMADLPVAYAKQIRKFATRQRGVLEAMCDEFWVGSAYLRNKYACWSPVLIEPRPGKNGEAMTAATRICYHGSASHSHELRWLVNVIASVQEGSDATHFEVTGDLTVNRLYRQLPRVSVLHPMGWSNYLAYTRSAQCHIGLAPLLPKAFNAARGYTKFFDYTRMGAVGIYSDVEPYRGFIRDGIDGILLPNDPVRWAREILALTLDAPRRHRIAAAAQARVSEMMARRSSLSVQPGSSNT